MVSALSSSKIIFGKAVITQAISIQFKEVYTSVLTRELMDQCPVNLYIAEVKLIMTALSSPQPMSGCGFWVSASWLSNAKKYYDALQLPDSQDLSKKALAKGKKGKLMKIRQRRGSDCLPPWPQINSEITCEHGNLSLSKAPRAKRRVIDKASWYTLRRFYGNGQQFKTSSCKECENCSEIESTAKVLECMRLDREKQSRQVEIHGALQALSIRKSGVPSECLHVRTPSNELSTSLIHRPLKPGLYHLAPRSWLKAWRLYIKDPNQALPPPLDCTCLLCTAHGLLLLPPHVVEYLSGARRSLLQGLTDYQGAHYEILSDPEWDALQSGGVCRSDFGVRFSCDGVDQLQWSLEICRRCSPFDFGEINVKTRLRGSVKLK